MEQVFEFASQYVTKEVISVLALLVTAWMGWKAASKSFSFVAGVARKASYTGIAATGLLAAGLGATGLGIGELWSRPSLDSTNAVGIDDDKLLKVATDPNTDEAIVKEVLTYASKRDERTSQKMQDKSDLAFVLKINDDGTLRAEKTSVVNAGLEIPIAPPTPAPLTEDEIQVEPVVEAALTAEESLVTIPIAWMLIGLGLAGSIAGTTVFVTRNDRKNPEDAHARV